MARQVHRDEAGWGSGQKLKFNTQCPDQWGSWPWLQHCCSRAQVGTKYEEALSFKATAECDGGEHPLRLISRTFWKSCLQSLTLAPLLKLTLIAGNQTPRGFQGEGRRGVLSALATIKTCISSEIELQWNNKCFWVAGGGLCKTFYLPLSTVSDFYV